MRKGDVHDPKLGVRVLQFPSSPPNHMHSGSHADIYTHYPCYALMDATAMHCSSFECEVVNCRPYFNFGRSCTRPARPASFLLDGNHQSAAESTDGTLERRRHPHVRHDARGRPAHRAVAGGRARSAECCRRWTPTPARGP